MIKTKTVKGMVSMIISTYNRKNSLNRCIKSVFKQDYKNKEVIVVDDASKDGSQVYIKKKYPSVKLITNRKNKGPNYCRNMGVINCKGEYLLFLDSDTELINRKQITKMVKIAKQKADLGELGGFYTKTKKKVAACKFDGLLFFNLKNRDSLQECEYVSSCNLFIKKELVYQYGGFDESIIGDGTELELGMNLKRKGYINLFGPDVAAKHYKSSLERDNIALRPDIKLSYSKLRGIWGRRTRLRYVFKNLGFFRGVSVFLLKYFIKDFVSILAFIKQQFLGLKTKDSRNFTFAEKIRHLLHKIRGGIDPLFWNILHLRETIRSRKINFLTPNRKISNL